MSSHTVAAILLDEDHPQPDRRRTTPHPLTTRWRLDGKWKFAFDDQDVGVRDKWYRRGLDDTEELETGSREIVVPFAYQTKASGIADKSHHELLWYWNSCILPGSSPVLQTYLLHFEAVDYECDVWVNGQHVTHHAGGSIGFEVEIPLETSTMHRVAGSEQAAKIVHIAVRVRDSNQPSQPRGKQYWRPSAGIMYTASSGIVGPVWMEQVSRVRLNARGLDIQPDIDHGTARISCSIARPGDYRNHSLAAEVELSFLGDVISRQTFPILQETITAVVLVGNASERPSKHLESALEGELSTGYMPESSPSRYRGFALWSPERPHLYDIRVRLMDYGSNSSIDEITSYLGMRKIEWSGGTFKLSGVPYFQRLVLDQGYWPDTGLTAPTTEALKKDILLAKELGFNGARKHQKVEDQRFQYWCDKLGFLLWSEMPNAFLFSSNYVESFTQEWLATVLRNMSHPSIVAWVPVNESWGYPNLNGDPRQKSHLRALYHLTKSLDPSRPVVLNDGWQSLSETDLYGHHDYSDPTEMAHTWSDLAKIDIGMGTRGKWKGWADGETYGGQPIICTEFGGLALATKVGDDPLKWGYATSESKKALVKGIRDRVQALLAGGLVQGFCYTQLTDCEQEVNGLLDAYRVPKAQLAELRAAIADTVAPVH